MNESTNRKRSARPEARPSAKAPSLSDYVSDDWKAASDLAETEYRKTASGRQARQARQRQRNASVNGASQAYSSVNGGTGAYGSGNSASGAYDTGTLDISGAYVSEAPGISNNTSDSGALKGAGARDTGSGRNTRASGRTGASSGSGNKKRKKSASAKRRTRRKIKTTLILLLILVVCGAAGFGALYYLRGGNFIDLNKPYAMSEEFASNLTKKEELRSQTFASDLCVVTGDVPLETASLGNDQCGLLVDMDKKKVIYSQGAFNKIYPASITKIMTGLLVLKYGDLSETVTITAEDLDLEEQAQVCGFTVGSELTMEQLLYCLLVYSGNDAAAAIASTIGGNEADFVSMMNSYAKQLGCTGTHFTNPHGLQDPDHYTTAYDIYLMLNEAYKYPIFTEITQLPSYTVTYKRGDGTEMATFLEATDHYLTGDATPPKDVKVLGGKTGTTTEAGNCLAVVSQNAYGHPYISVVLGASTKDVLYQEMNSLLQAVNETT